MRTQLILGIIALNLACVSLRAAEPVTVENFTRAETDRYFGNVVRDGGFGKFHHHREMVPIDKQTVIRSNRDTLYSSGVFDLNEGPVTIFLPDAGERFMSLMVITEDHYCPDVVYEPGRYSFSREKYVTRYIMLATRILVDPSDPEDLQKVHALQDAIQVEQPGGPGKFEVPNWDQVSQKKVRDALLTLATTVPDTKRMFGRKDEVDPVRHLIGTAMGWGGNPEKDAFYLNVTPAANDGETIYRLTVNDVPVDGFWSISVYGADGHFHKNDRDAYSVNNITAKKNADGSVTVRFGGDANAAPNVLPITPGWNYLVRLYRPRQEILEGTWKFPEAQPVNAEVGEVMLSGLWVLTNLNGKPIAGRHMTLEFDAAAGRASGSTGVNRWSGGYKLSGWSLDFGPLITTRRAGTPEAMQLEREFTQALGNVTQIAGDAERLELSAGDKELLVFDRFQP